MTTQLTSRATCISHHERFWALFDFPNPWQSLISVKKSPWTTSMSLSSSWISRTVAFVASQEINLSVLRVALKWIAPTECKKSWNSFVKHACWMKWFPWPSTIFWKNCKRNLQLLVLRKTSSSLFWSITRNCRSFLSTMKNRSCSSESHLYWERSKSAQLHVLLKSQIDYQHQKLS